VSGDTREQPYHDLKQTLRCVQPRSGASLARQMGETTPDLQPEDRVGRSDGQARAGQSPAAALARVALAAHP